MNSKVEILTNQEKVDKTHEDTLERFTRIYNGHEFKSCSSLMSLSSTSYFCGDFLHPYLSKVTDFDKEHLVLSTTMTDNGNEGYVYDILHIAIDEVKDFECKYNGIVQCFLSFTVNDVKFAISLML